MRPHNPELVYGEMELPTRGILSGLGRTDEARKVVRRVLNVSIRVVRQLIEGRRLVRLGGWIGRGRRGMVAGVVSTETEKRLWVVWLVEGRDRARYGRSGPLDRRSIYAIGWCSEDGITILDAACSGDGSQLRQLLTRTGS